MHVIEGGAAPMGADEMRAEAERRLERAEELRAAAEREEQAAWGLRARAAVEDARGRVGAHARRRPRVEGDPAMSRNRLILMMEVLAIDEPVVVGEGLDGPLRMVEARLGVCYARRGMPVLGVRIANCEAALAHDVLSAAAAA